jgi:hypothetical protein
MRRKLMMCPETGHQEEITYVPSPLGTLVTSCTRFSPACSLRCARQCVAHEHPRSTADVAEWLEQHGAAVETDEVDE